MPPKRKLDENSLLIDDSASYTPKRKTSARRPLQEIQSNPSTPCRPPAQLDNSTTTTKRRLIHQNGYIKTPKIPTYSPFAPPSKKRCIQATPERQPTQPIQPQNPPSDDTWAKVASQVLKPQQSLRSFQKEATTAVIQRRDVTVVASTGLGKSLLFVLPLAFHPDGVVLVITPLRSLAIAQVKELTREGYSAVFVTKPEGPHDKIPTKDIVDGKFQVVFCCPEMLECPTFAPVLHATSFLRRITHIVIDESHCIVEMAVYRPSYTRLTLLRTTLRSLKVEIPIVQMSATRSKFVLRLLRFNSIEVTNIRAY